MLRVARRANTINASATTQQMIIEFVIGNPKIRTTSDALCEMPCSSVSVREFESRLCSMRAPAFVGHVGGRRDIRWCLCDRHRRLTEANEHRDENA